MLPQDQPSTSSTKKASGFQCPDPGCSHTFSKRARLNRHVRSKHKEVPSPRKIYKCDGCKYATSFSTRFRAHLLFCHKHQELHPRVVPILTRKQLIKIHKAGNTSDRKFLNILKDIEKEAGARLFEDNLEQEIRDSINSWQHLYSVKEVEIKDKNGNPMKSSLAWVNDLNGLIATIIKENNIKKPRVVVGGDSGQKKFIYTLSVFDMDDLSVDFAGYSRAGKRRTLIIAACDDLEECPENLHLITDHLKLDEMEYLDFILAGDLKFANLCFGLQTHQCLHPCVYCFGSKVLNGKKTTLVEGDWEVGEDRTSERCQEERDKWLRQCGHLAISTRRAKLSNYGNCENVSITLPPGKDKVKIVFLLPPDPLHVILLGTYYYVMFDIVKLRVQIQVLVMSMF